MQTMQTTQTGTNRRSLLRSSLFSIFAGLAGLPGMVARPGAADAHSIKKYPDSCGVLVDLSRCIGCRSCEAACNAEQGLPPPAHPFTDMTVFDERRSASGHVDHTFDSDGERLGDRLGDQQSEQQGDRHHEQHRPRRTDSNHYTVVRRYTVQGREDHPLYRKIQCNHCQEPACVASCFVNAYTKTPQGPVIYDASVCVGCRTCMVACPFYIPTFTYDKAFNPRIEKCWFCYDSRVKDGLPPACVDACPQEALIFGYREELLKVARGRIARPGGNYVPHIYGEYEAGGTAWLYISDVPFEEVGFDTALPDEPILDSVKAFLGFVPMVLTIWPALFAGFHLLATRKQETHSVKESSGEEDL